MFTHRYGLVSRRCFTVRQRKQMGAILWQRLTRCLFSRQSITRTEMESKPITKLSRAYRASNRPSGWVHRTAQRRGTKIREWYEFNQQEWLQLKCPHTIGRMYVQIIEKSRIMLTFHSVKTDLLSKLKLILHVLEQFACSLCQPISRFHLGKRNIAYRWIPMLNTT